MANSEVTQISDLRRGEASCQKQVDNWVFRRFTESACQLVDRISHRMRERGTEDECDGPLILMDHSYSRTVIEILRSTLSRLETDSGFRQDDPAVVQLKRHILQSLAEFESQKADETVLEPQPSIELEAPISVLRLR